MERFHRYYRLHQVLAGARRPVSRQALETALECSRATVVRVIDGLRAYGAPIEYVREHNGWRFAPGVAYELPGLWFNPSPSLRWIVDALAHSGELRGRAFSVLVSPLEHPSLMKCLQAKAQAGKITLEVIPFKDGILQIDALTLKGVEVVIVTGAHNETGYLPDMAAIADSLLDDTIFISEIFYLTFPHGFI